MASLDFEAYARQLAQTNNRQSMLPVIEKELLHYEILKALGEAQLLDDLVFQGGTCLRLCYGSPRYSEDLDFVGGSDFSVKKLSALKTCIEKALPQKYSVEVKVTEPKKRDSFVSSWRIRIDTSPERPDMPSQKISFEVAAVASYTKEARMLQLNYEGLISSYGDIVVQTESLAEIMADKLESFVCASHVRYRDLWDLHWLSRHASINREDVARMRKQKEIDYQEQERFAERLPLVLDDLEEIVESEEFAQEMKRFLPVDEIERTLDRPLYRKALTAAIRDLYAMI